MPIIIRKSDDPMTEQEIIEWLLRDYDRREKRRALKTMLRTTGGTIALLNILLSLTIITPGPVQIGQIVLGLAAVIGSLFVRET